MNRKRRLPWRVALAAFLVLLVGAPAPTLVALGPQQTVTSRNPFMGIHTRLTDEVEEYKIKRTLEMVREMGASWIVEYFPWAYYEPSPGRYDWSHADLVVDHARRQGLTVIARLGMVPDWARPNPDVKPTTNTYLDEEHYAAFADFVYAFVRHFRGRVDHIVVWNEPNISLEWGYRPVDPAGLYRPAARRLSPRQRGQPGRDRPGRGAGAHPGAGGRPGRHERPGLFAAHAGGRRRRGDGRAGRPRLRLAAAARRPGRPGHISLARVELLHQMLVEAGYGDMPVYITEGGWNDHPRWTKAVQPSQRAAFTVRAYEKALAEWPWCRAFVVWAFRYPRPANTYGDYFTFVTTDFTPKPIYYAVQRYARGEAP